MRTVSEIAKFVLGLRTSGESTMRTVRITDNGRWRGTDYRLLLRISEDEGEDYTLKLKPEDWAAALAEVARAPKAE